MGCAVMCYAARAYDRTLASPDLQALRMAKFDCDCGSGVKSADCCHRYRALCSVHRCLLRVPNPPLGLFRPPCWSHMHDSLSGLCIRATKGFETTSWHVLERQAALERQLVHKPLHMIYQCVSALACRRAGAVLCCSMVPAEEGGVLWPHYHCCDCHAASCNRHRPQGCQEYYESQGYNNPRSAQNTLLYGGGRSP